VAQNAKGQWRAQLTLQGQDRERTVLRLKDGAAGFGDAAQPRAMLATGSHWQEGDAEDGGGNKAFRNNLLDLTLDTGAGNPGAVAVDYAVSNHGTIQNVTVRSGDGAGVAGIRMQRRIPGPGLIKQVLLEGFDVGLDIGDIQYGVTLEHVTVRDQRVAGIRVGQNLLHGRRITSVNRVPALLVTRLEGVATILDSKFTGGSREHPAIQCDGTLLLRDVATEGYRPAALVWRGKEIALSNFKEWVGPEPSGEATVQGGLLPIEETPEYWNADLQDWEAVGPRNEGESDDTGAIQRAIDSGRSTVYFPIGRTYFLSDTVVVRGKVREILGMGSEISLGAAKDAFGDRNHPRPLFRIDPTESREVFFRHLFFNAQYPGEILFENNSPATVVIEHCGGWVGAEGSRRSYRNTPRGTGKLFVEDVFLPGWEFRGQRVWARQFNPENYDGKGDSPQVTNDGGRLWILGFKTEGPAPFLATRGGGITELLGAYNYISATKNRPRDAVSYPVADSQAALTFATDNFDGDDYAVHVRETRGGMVVGERTPEDLPPRDGRRGCRSLAVPLYRSPTGSADPEGT
jgi:hypothetical protein